MILLDTCTISELVKKQPNSHVIKWFDKQNENELFVSVLTIGELQKGISKLEASKRKDQILSWFNSDFLRRFETRIVPIDQEISLTWGELCGNSEKEGQKLPVIDSLLAASALTKHAKLATRNTEDFLATKVQLINPWEALL